MAIALASKTNVIAPAFPYSFGRIKNNSGLNDGTPVDQNLLSDAMEFFEVLMSNGAITPNGLPENGSNGHQYLTALTNTIYTQVDVFHKVGAALQPAYQNSFVTSTYGGSDGCKYCLISQTQMVQMVGAFQKPVELNDTTVFTLPIGYRPQNAKNIPILLRNNGNYLDGVLKIATNGNVSVNCTNGDAATTAVYLVDGVQFPINDF